MIGTASKQTFDENIFLSVEKEKKIKKSMQIRFITLIILSNIFTALFVTSGETPSSTKPEENVIQIEKGFSKLILEIDLLGPLEEKGKTEVSLFLNGNVLLSKKAYIHKKLTSDNALDGSEKYLIEIPSDELHKYVSNGTKKILAFPPHQQLMTNKIFKQTPRNENDEIDF